MAKREFIDRQALIEHDKWSSIHIASVFNNDIITEEEIVKPYLEKLKAELIAKYPKDVYGEPELGGLSCEFSLNKLLEMIDNLLTEKGAEE